MSKHVFIHLLLIGLLFTIGTPLFAETTPVFSKDSSIVILPFPIPSRDKPKAPELIPFAAYYDSSVSSVLLSFRSNLGVIEVEVLNSTTGGYSSIFVDTQFLYSVIPITLGSGHYIIIFTLPSGQHYQGEFDI